MAARRGDGPGSAASRTADAAARIERWVRGRVGARLRVMVGGGARLQVLTLLACVLALQAADATTIGATASQLERDLGIGNTEVGLLVTASTGVGAVATLPVGVLVDRVNRTRLLAVAIAIWSLAMVGSGLATSYSMLLFTRLALGAIAAAAAPAVASLTGDFFPVGERGRIYGWVLSGELIGAGVGLVVSGDIAAVSSWRVAFFLLAVPGFALAWLIWRALPEPARNGPSRIPAGADRIPGVGGNPPSPVAHDEDGAVGADHVSTTTAADPHVHLVLHDDPTRKSLWWAIQYVLSIRTNRVLIVASALGYFFFSGLRTFAVVFLQGRYGVGQATATTLLFLIGLGAIGGVLVSGRVADALLGRGLVTARPFVAGVMFLVSGMLFLPGLATSVLAEAMILFFLAAAALGGANPPLDAARLDLMPAHLWGRAESVRTVLRTGLAAAAPLLFGLMSELFGGGGVNAYGPSHPAAGTGLANTFSVMLVPLLAAGLLILLRARQSYPRDVATATESDRILRRTRRQR